jgi:hypothetical protein
MILKIRQRHILQNIQTLLPVKEIIKLLNDFVNF